MKTVRLLALLSLLLAAPVSASAAQGAYATDGDCGGRPMTTVRMAPGYCLGLVWQGAGAEGPRMPRGLLALPNGDWLVTDLANWYPGNGAIWRLSFGADGAPRWRRLALLRRSGDAPAGLECGPGAMQPARPPGRPAAAPCRAAKPDLLRRGDVPRTAWPAADELARLSSRGRPDRGGRDGRRGPPPDRYRRPLRHL